MILEDAWALVDQKGASSYCIHFLVNLNCCVHFLVFAFHQTKHAMLIDSSQTKYHASISITTISDMSVTDVARGDERGRLDFVKLPRFA